MKNIYSFLILCLLNVFCLDTYFAQIKKPVDSKPLPIKPVKEKKYLKLSVKAGANLSVVYLARNIKEDNNEPGYSGGLTYEVNNFVRVSGLYTQFKPLNIAPTWLNVKAKTIEANLEVLANFPNGKTLLYPFAGVSYNSFSGLFTGESDYLNLKEFYQSNTIVKNNYLGLNLGTGIEHTFGVIGLYLDYRMRVGKQDGNINIMDVCYTGGVKIHFPYGKAAKSVFHYNDKYHWF
jgi:hypothetical protein